MMAFFVYIVIMKEIKFKKFGGEIIDDVVEYILDYIKVKGSDIQISIGCDSQTKRRRVNYAITIVLYDGERHNGAHYIFKRLKIPKSYLRNRKRVSQWHHDKVENFNDVNITETDDLILNRLWNEVEYLLELGVWLDEKLQGRYYVKHSLNDYDGSQPTRLPVLHVDFNPDEGTKRENKSNKLYASAMGMLSGMGFKVVGKPDAFASSSAADLLCKF